MNLFQRLMSRLIPDDRQEVIDEGGWKQTAEQWQGTAERLRGELADLRSQFEASERHAREIGEARDQLVAELEQCKEFRTAVCDALGDCTARLPRGETWAAMDDSVIQYLTEIVRHTYVTADELARVTKELARMTLECDYARRVTDRILLSFEECQSRAEEISHEPLPDDATEGDEPEDVGLLHPYRQFMTTDGSMACADCHAPPGHAVHDPPADKAKSDDPEAAAMAPCKKRAGCTKTCSHRDKHAKSGGCKYVCKWIGKPCEPVPAKPEPPAPAQVICDHAARCPSHCPMRHRMAHGLLYGCHRRWCDKMFADVQCVPVLPQDEPQPNTADGGEEKRR